jgi:SagB-type dehydrogenase family enzyme
MEISYRRAPHICLRWEGGALLCTSGITGREFRLSPGVVRVLDGLDAGATREEICRRAAIPMVLVERLIDSDLLVPATSGAADGLVDPGVAYWNSYELVLQRMTGRGKRRSGYLETPMPAPRRRHPGPTVQLPEFDEADLAGVPFASVLAGRRSRRVFSERPLTLAQLAALLVGAARVTSADEERGVSYRPYPSGGGRHPLEIYVLPLRVDGLSSDAVYHFDPSDRQLVSLVGRDGIGALLRDVAAAMAEDPATESNAPAAMLLLTSFFGRTLWKYEYMGLATIYKDVGCLTQTLYLQSIALGLAGCAVGGGPEQVIAGGLGLDHMEESYVGAFFVGHPEEHQPASAFSAPVPGARRTP